VFGIELLSETCLFVSAEDFAAETENCSEAFFKFPSRTLLVPAQEITRPSGHSVKVMPPAKSKPAAPLPPAALPTMPSLDLVDQTEDFDDEEDDPQDENHLMNILYKLKNAKTTLDSSRQK
jgi:hypothetical protein